MNAYLLVVDTDGIAVDSAVVGRKLTAEKVVTALKKTEVESRVKRKKLVSLGKVARLAIILSQFEQIVVAIQLNLLR